MQDEPGQHQDKNRLGRPEERGHTCSRATQAKQAECVGQAGIENANAAKPYNVTALRQAETLHQYNRPQEDNTDGQLQH